MYLFPVMECLTSMIPAVGIGGFQNEAIHALIKCMRINENTLLMNNYADYYEDYDTTGSISKQTPVPPTTGAILPPNTTNYFVNIQELISSPGYSTSAKEDDIPPKDFAICALDMLSSIVSTLKEHFAMLLASTDGEINKEQLFHDRNICPAIVKTDAIFMNVLLICLQDKLVEVKQSTFSLIGDVCRYCPSLILPSAHNNNQHAILSQILAVTLENISNHADNSKGMFAPMLCNDALWMFGELILQIQEYCKNNNNPNVAAFMGPEFIQQHVMPTVMRVLSQCCKNNQQLPPSVQQNAGILLSRLVIVNPSAIDSVISSCFASWCK